MPASFATRALLTASLTAPLTFTATAQYSLSVLHNNDAESQVLNAGSGLEEFGGVARFTTLLNDTRSFYEGLGHGVLAITSGDNFLPGPEFTASLETGAPGSRDFYDALAISRIGYDAVIIGNHDFDLGPQVLAEFIGDAQTTNPTTYLSANLDFSANADLKPLVTAGTLAPSTLIDVPTAAGTKKVGIIGATTENLPFISSPGDVIVNAVVPAVNAQISALQGMGADHIILSSHLQGIDEELALIPQLDPGIDLVIAGGGDNLLANDPGISPASINAGASASVSDTGFVPGDGSEGAYPNITALDSANNVVPVVATDANYKYLGRVTLDFDAAGNLIGATPDSNPQRVASLTADPTNGVAPDALVAADVAPVQTFVDGLAADIIGNTSDTLIQGGSNGIRSDERAVGNLVADAFLNQAGFIAGQGDFADVDEPDITLINGGGIRADIAAGDISRLDTFNVSPFSNFVAIVEDVTRDDLKLLLENAYSRTVDGPEAGIDPVRQGSGTGRFAQVAGFTVEYDILAQPLVLNPDGTIAIDGERILNVTLDDGTPIVVDGQVQLGDTLDIATATFLANGGDQYFSAYLSQNYSASINNLRISDQQALEAFITSFGGVDLASILEYDNVPDGRIITVPEPAATTALLGLAGLALRRRRA